MGNLEHRKVAVEDPAEIRPAELRDLFDHWLLHSLPDRPPRRRELDVAAMRPVLPNAALVWVSARPAVVEYRIVGGNIVQLLGVDPVGRRPEQLFRPQVANEVTTVLTRAMLSGKPSYDLCEYRVPDLSAGYRRLVLPLAHERTDAGFVIVCAYPAENWQQAAGDWRNILAAPGTNPGAVAEGWQTWSAAQGDPDYEIVYV